MTSLEAKMENINMSDAKSHFSEFLSRAAGGERFVILRRERPLAAIIGAGELARLERSAEIARRLAQTLGQSRKLLESIEAGMCILLWLRMDYGRMKMIWLNWKRL
jgi:prevent-host-death family protein